MHSVFSVLQERNWLLWSQGPGVSEMVYTRAGL